MKNILKTTQSKIVAGAIAAIVIVSAAGAAAVKMDKINLSDLKTPGEVVTQALNPIEPTQVTITEASAVEAPVEAANVGKSQPASQK